MTHAKTLPYEVEDRLQKLGANIRTARIRRNISIAEMAERLGVHRSVVGDVERGRPGTAMSAYMGALWVLDLLHDMEDVAHPENDTVGQTLARNEERERASRPRGMTNDF